MTYFYDKRTDQKLTKLLGLKNFKHF